MNFEEFHRGALNFLDALFADFEKHKISLESSWDIDHICYRTENSTRYEELKKDWSRFAQLLVESVVNGRLIATYKLTTPISYQGWKIDVVELPAPKAGKVVREGFEHVEVVTGLSFEKLEQRFSHLPLDRTGMKKDFNPELEVALGERNFKLHPLSLESVIRTEKNARAWNALSKSKVLSLLKEEQAIVAGTFPLGVDTADSDLDILIRTADFAAVESKLQSLGVAMRSSCSTVDGLDSLVLNFVYEGVPFEIFAQDRHPIEQRAYRHFLVEEKLLKRGGAPLREKIMILRHQGIKTEPAFAKTLGLPGDPYEALLDLDI